MTKPIDPEKQKFNLTIPGLIGLITTIIGMTWGAASWMNNQTTLRERDHQDMTNGFYQL